MADVPITERELAEWHDLGINTMADALVGDVASKVRMAASASTLASACLRLLVERADLQARVAALEQQLAAEREWITEATMELRSFALQSNLLEKKSPMNDWPAPSPEDVRGILGDLGGVAPEDYLHSRYSEHNDGQRHNQKGEVNHG